MKQINPTRAVFGSICFVALLAANKVPSKPQSLEFTPYQLLAWEIKANEGFVDHWYFDGVVRGKKSHSIGFGWNDQGRRRAEAKPFLNSNGRITYAGATKLTLYEIKKYGKLDKDPLKNLALQLYSYSRGLTKDGSKLGKCCGAKWGCGNDSKNVRKSHTRRRKFETACWNHDYEIINTMTNQNQIKVRQIISRL